MATALPPNLQRLLQAPDAASRDAAWDAFMDEYGRLLLHAARSVEPVRDDAMDALARILEGLRADDHRRLRAYTVQDGARFSTWLTAVARRIALDERRRRLGRPRDDEDARRTRRQLSLLGAAGVPLDHVPVRSASAPPDATIEVAERRAALAGALATLAAEDHLLIQLRFRDEAPVREIATLLGLPTVFHVYRRIAAVLRQLRTEMERRGVDGAAT